MLLQENREVAVPLFGREMVMCSAKTVQTLKKCLKSSFGITDNSFNKPRARYIQAQSLNLFGTSIKRGSNHIRLSIGQSSRLEKTGTVLLRGRESN